jgi:hypothetical protein
VVELSVIRLQVGGRDLTLHSCVRCEQRWWDRDGKMVYLDHVLDLIGSRTTVDA